LKKKNVIMFVVDSVRHYSTGGLDDRDKLEMMDEFEKESVYFPLTISSAPSSIMSLSSMLTGLPAYYIARNYDDFKYDNNQFISLHNILKDKGYDVKSLFNARELRFLFGDVLNHIDKKYWTHEVNNNQLNWSNAQMNEILANFLRSKKNEKPFFMIVWYNVRLDSKTSQHIDKGIGILKENNVWNDSIFTLSSDHGYMDPRRGYTPEKLKKLGLSHDLLMSDDNIRIPFYLKYPNCPIKKIEQQVSTLDILPTILSLLNIDYPKSKTYKMEGMDLISLINGDKEAIPKFSTRKVRSDARFFAQADRATAFRDGRYKYVIRPDKNIEEFYDIDNDYWEEDNFIENSHYKKLISEFRISYNESENQILDFQYRYLLNKIPSSLKNKNKKLKILVCGFGEPHYLDNVSKIMKEFWDEKVELNFITSNQVEKKMKESKQFSRIFTFDIENFRILDKSITDIRYDFLIILIDNYNLDLLNKVQKKIIRFISYEKKLIFDPNMELVSRTKTLKRPTMILNVICKKKGYYLNNPKMILHHFIKWLKIITKGN